MSNSIILMDSEDGDQTLTITHDKDNGCVEFVCEDGTYQTVWTDHLITALKKIGAIENKKVKS